VAILMSNQLVGTLVGAVPVADSARDEPRHFRIGIHRVHRFDIAQVKGANRQTLGVEG
jgi:hypothetical protein